MTRNMIDALLRRTHGHREPARRRGAVGVWLDLRQAVRGLRRRPTYFIAGVVTLALGIGAGTAIFSVAWHSLLRPMPYPEAERTLVLFDRPLDQPTSRSNMNVAAFLELRERSRAFAAMSAFEYASFVVGGDADPAQVLGMRVNAGFFGMLGLPPRLGRDFIADDDVAGAAPVGVRVALGATRTGILRMVCMRGLRLAASGVLLGMIGAIVAGRAIAHLLWNVSPVDPLTLTGTATLFVLAALAGCALPARRAASFDVGDVLRQE